jgi:hypothetical protein
MVSTVAGLASIGLFIWALSREDYVRVCGHQGGPVLLIAISSCLTVVSLIGARRFAGAWEGGAIIVPAIAVVFALLAWAQLPGSPHGCGQ